MKGMFTTVILSLLLFFNSVAVSFAEDIDINNYNVYDIVRFMERFPELKIYYDHKLVELPLSQEKKAEMASSTVGRHTYISFLIGDSQEEISVNAKSYYVYYPIGITGIYVYGENESPDPMIFFVPKDLDKDFVTFKAFMDYGEQLKKNREAKQKEKDLEKNENSFLGAVFGLFLEHCLIFFIIFASFIVFFPRPTTDIYQWKRRSYFFFDTFQESFKVIIDTYRVFREK